jgi:hypothetical protein
MKHGEAFYYARVCSEWLYDDFNERGSARILCASDAAGSPNLYFQTAA